VWERVSETNSSVVVEGFDHVSSRSGGIDVAQFGLRSAPL